MNTENDIQPVKGNHEAHDIWMLVNHYMAPIADFLKMPGVTEICINAFDDVRIRKNGAFEKTALRFKDNGEVEKLIEQIGNGLDQPVHKENHPILDARLPGKNGRTGARINAVMSSVATRGACMTIRVFPEVALTADDLLNNGAINNDILECLRIAALCRCNVIISGGTDSGKTTLTNVFCSFIPHEDRVITIEDTIELHITAPHLVSMEAPRKRKDKDKNAQDVTMAFLLENALRQRPDRIIVGEIRSADAANSFLQAINTGHSGCVTTLHANSTYDALTRMEILAASQGNSLPHEVIKAQVRGNIHLLIHQETVPDHGRRLVELSEVVDYQPRVLWRWDYAQKTHVSEQDFATSSIACMANRYGISSHLLL
jgi:pilus assembly protein CpaF